MEVGHRMDTLASLFAKPIERNIEEVIKVTQDDEKIVLAEIDEYVVTESIRDQYAEVFKAIAEGATYPREGVGIWISGFFGSGKSSFAKILGYTAANRKVGDSSASLLFKKTANDQRISDLLDSINKRIPFQSIIFDVSMDSGRAGDERLTEILYKALLKGLDYAVDFDLAELEISLEEDGKLERFQELFEAEIGKPWKLRRQLGLAVNEASAVLHSMDGRTFPNTDSWAVTIGSGRADIDPSRLAQRAFELTALRAPGKALIFIIDEVGQFVSRSVEKMLDLQAIVQAFGVEGRNRTERRQAVSPYWIAVTSQEKLNEVVTALDSKKIELARLQDRFRINVDLKQADIAEITARRVLAKREDAVERLTELFRTNSGRIRDCCALERTSRNIEITSTEFVRLYPYLPYQIDLSIDIVSGLRLKRGAQRHVGGSNRTIIKQAQQMLINERTKLAEAQLGTLVTLDKVYELLEAGNLIPSEITGEIRHVEERLPDKPMALKAAMVIALLESVKDLPRTAHNIAAVLHPSVYSPSLKNDVEDALVELEKGQFIRNSEEGYKLLTVQEKNWEIKRNGLDPREADRNAIHREIIREIYSEPKMRIHQYENLKSFRLGVTFGGDSVDGEGDIPLHLHLVNKVEMEGEIEALRARSAEKQDEIFWLVPFPPSLRDNVAELYRSREMVSETDRLAAQNRLTADEAACLAEEKNKRDRLHREMKNTFSKAIAGGTFFSRGVSKEGTSLGSTLGEMMRGIVDLTVPQLFDKLRTGVLGFSSADGEKFLVAANLSGLSKGFYGEKNEDSLVVKQGDNYIPNLTCALCKGLFDFINRECAYGNTVTGKSLENHFGGKGYAWELESIRVGLAVLFRGGALEVSHQGKKYTKYDEPAVRPVFTNTPLFRAASFRPRQSIDLKLLVSAAKMFEAIEGRSVDPEENALSNELKRFAEETKKNLIPLEARLSALHVPGAEVVSKHLKWMDEIIVSDSGECVKTLASSGKTLAEQRTYINALAASATDENLKKLESARRVLKEQWSALRERGEDGPLSASAEELEQLLHGEDCLANVEKIKILMGEIHASYLKVYQDVWEKRRIAYEKVLEFLKGRPEWIAFTENSEIPSEIRENLLKPISVKVEQPLHLEPFASFCSNAKASVSQLETDAEAAKSIASKVLGQIIKMIAPEERVERISVSRMYQGRIATQEELDDFIASLNDRLGKIIAGGGTILLE